MNVIESDFKFDNSRFISLTLHFNSAQLCNTPVYQYRRLLRIALAIVGG